jgi:hypothetical protein
MQQLIAHYLLYKIVNKMTNDTLNLIKNATTDYLLSIV